MLTDYREKLIFALLFLVALVLRISFLDSAKLRSDETHYFFQTALFHYQPYPLYTGPLSSVGLFHFPLFNYFLIVLYFFLQSHRSWIVFFAVINSLTIPIFFLILRKHFSLLVATASVLIFASSPWVLNFSRIIWPQALMHSLLILALYPFLRALREKELSSLWSFLLVVLLGLISQLHFSGFLLVAAIISLFLILRVKINLKAAIGGLLAVSLTILPYLYYGLSTNNLCPLCSYLNSGPKSTDPTNFFLPYWTMGGVLLDRILFGQDYAEFVGHQPSSIVLDWVFAIQALLLQVGLTFLALKRPGRFFLPIFFLITFVQVFFFLTRTPAAHHYYVIVYPLIALVFGLILKFIFTSGKGRAAKIATIGLFGFFTFTNLLFQSQLYNFINNKKGIKGDYGTIISVTESRIRQISEERGVGGSSLEKQVKNFLYLCLEKRIALIQLEMRRMKKYHPDIYQYILTHLPECRLKPVVPEIENIAI